MRIYSSFLVIVALLFGYVTVNAEDGIKVGGAVRFGYSYENYNEGNQERGGDFDFDTFRLNLDGTVKDVQLSAEWRYYDYMQVIHHAWVGYNFNQNTQLQAGITQVPFGNLKFNSNNFFFSSNFYLGLEDDYDLGLKLVRDAGPLNLQFAFFKNDELGGVDGYVSDRTERYSYDVVGERPASEGTYAAPANEIGEGNTFVGRLAYTFGKGSPVSNEIGVSFLGGTLFDANDDVGTYNAYALHLNSTFKRFGLKAQITDYTYDLDSGNARLAVGAYAFYDTIASEATTYTLGISYSMPVNIGPISNLKFYNDYSQVTNKSGNLKDTTFNALGVEITAGNVYAYVDYFIGENQPFVGGTFDSTTSDSEERFNINIGYYF